MIILVTYIENTKYGKRIRTSHGVDVDTDAIVIMPPEDPLDLGAVFDQSIGEYVIYGDTKKFI